MKIFFIFLLLISMTACSNTSSSSSAVSSDSVSQKDLIEDSKELFSQRYQVYDEAKVLSFQES